MNDATEPKDLLELAEGLEMLFTSRHADISTRIAAGDRNIRQLESLTLLSEMGERSKTLASSWDALTEAKRLLKEARTKRGFGGFPNPISIFKKCRIVRKTRAALAIEEAHFDAPSTKAERDSRIANHNQDVYQNRTRLPGLYHELAELKSRQSASNRLHNLADGAMHAARDGGWTAPDFAERFRQLVFLVKINDIDNATILVKTLIFQRRPTDSQYKIWNQEAVSLRNTAYRQYTGTAASGAYPTIAQNSIRLALHTLSNQAAATLTTYTHTADQWQALSAILADPRRFRTDALWSVYWAMYQCGQSLAYIASEADPHEDVLTGKATAQIDRWLAGWAAERISEFGYPAIRSYLGTLEIASSTEETRLGADIGVIVDLNIGGLVCRKVAMFQAKKGKNGFANVGSRSKQLSKLAERPQAGFYLIYHQSVYPVMAPAPSVCAAHELAYEVTRLGKDISASHLPLNVRDVGWDWASFVSFGLCNPDSKVGESFNTIEDAMAALGSGDPRHLPRYLHVIAIADEPRVLELRTKVHEHYFENLKTMGKTREKNLGSRERNMYDRGISR